MEIFKKIPLFPDYEVSNQGRVKSLKGHIPILLKSAPGSGNILHVILYCDRIKYTRTIHTLVLEAFIGMRPPGTEGCHNDGNPNNNNVENLRWDTHANNLRDRKKHGTDNGGTRNGMSKLNEQEVLEIRKLLVLGNFTQKQIGLLFGVSRRTISFIKTNQRWTWL